MKNAIILHAMGDGPSNFWYPWLKNELGKRGYSVWVPQLADTNNPQLSVQVPFVMSQGTFNEETVLIGHSAGASLILSILEEVNVKIAQAILVGGFSYYPGGDGILKPSYNWEKIQAHVNEFYIINSDNDPYGHDDVRGRVMFEMLNMPGSVQIIVKGQGHFGTEEFNQTYTDFPLLLKLIA